MANWSIWVNSVAFICLTVAILFPEGSCLIETNNLIDVEKTIVWGPGLTPDFNVPVRYFFIQAVSEDGSNFTVSAGDSAFDVTIVNPTDSRIRHRVQIFDTHDGIYIVRFKLHKSYDGLIISIFHRKKHVGKSPYELKGTILHEKCYCPEPDIEQWYDNMGCPASYRQIKLDLAPFTNVDLETTAEETINRFNVAGAYSLCRYKILDNKVYRKCQGKHVGFKMFSDSALLSLTRKVRLPDVEMFINLGDWPLENRPLAENPAPIFSWCGSDESRDIVMPTYDIMEATLEMMGRVSLDLFSVMGNGEPEWANKTDLAFWRGRDSRQERLDLVVMSRKLPDVIDAAMTHMFFFPKDVEKYGELVKSISFFDFFKHKYQITLDGTVAAYRLPYLLAGNAVVLKQDSPYYEHFYKNLIPYKHYIPFKRNLDDLLEQIQWAKDNDDEVQQISKNARDYVMKNILPADILCYHVKLFHNTNILVNIQLLFLKVKMRGRFSKEIHFSRFFKQYSKRLKSPPLPAEDDWDLVEQPSGWEAECDCPMSHRDPPASIKDKHDEL